MTGNLKAARKSVPWLLSAVPALILLYMILRFHVNVPFYDEWEIPLLLEKWHQGSLHFSDLWGKHNEHRIFFPNLVFLALAGFSSWNLLYEELFNFLLAIGSFLLITRLVKKTEDSLGPCGSLLLLPLVSAVVFSLRQWENWTWGFQNVFYHGVFGALAGIVLLSGLVFSWKRLWLAVLCGLLSIYSFSCGILFWPVAFFLLCFHTFPDKATRSRAIFLWLVVSALALWGYFYDFEHLTRHPSLEYGVQKPVEFARYFLAYLGSPFGSSRYAYQMGLAVFFVFTALSVFLFLKLKKREAYLGYVTLGLFSIGNALITTVGRAGFGDVQAVTSRYTTICYPLWAAVILLGAVSYKVLESRLFSMPGRRVILKISTSIFIVIFLLRLLKVSYASIEYMGARSEVLRKASHELFLLQDDALLKEIHPDPNFVRKITPIMRERRWALFNEDSIK